MNRAFVSFVITALFFGIAGLLWSLVDEIKDTTQKRQEKISVEIVHQTAPKSVNHGVAKHNTDSSDNKPKTDSAKQSKKTTKPQQKIATKRKHKQSKKAKKRLKRKPKTHNASKQKSHLKNHPKHSKHTSKKKRKKEKRKISHSSINNFAARVRAKIKSNLGPKPRLAVRKNISGSVVIDFDIKPNGSVDRVNISGVSLFKKSAKRALRASVPFDTSGVRSALPRHYSVPITYK